MTLTDYNLKSLADFLLNEKNETKAQMAAKESRNTEGFSSYGNDAKGKFAEILTSWHVNKVLHDDTKGLPEKHKSRVGASPLNQHNETDETHMAAHFRGDHDSPARVHDAIVKTLQREKGHNWRSEYESMNSRCRSMAFAGIRHARKNGLLPSSEDLKTGRAQVHSVHWTSNGDGVTKTGQPIHGDHHRITGDHDPNNRSDFIVTHTTGGKRMHTGFSVKFGSQEKTNDANPGMETLKSWGKTNELGKATAEHQARMDKLPHLAGLNQVQRKAAHKVDLKAAAGGDKKAAQRVATAEQSALEAKRGEAKALHAGLAARHKADPNSIKKLAADVLSPVTKHPVIHLHGHEDESYHGGFKPKATHLALKRKAIMNNYSDIKPTIGDGTSVVLRGTPKPGKEHVNTEIATIAFKNNSGPHTGLVASVTSGAMAKLKGDLETQEHGSVQRKRTANYLRLLRNKKKALVNESEDVNTHLTHIEDRVIDHGQKGLHLAVRTLYGVHDSLKGRKTTTKTTIKKDGAPAIFAGHKDGKFFVATKSLFNKNSKINYNHADIERNHGHAPGLVDKLKQAHDHLQKVIPNDGRVYQGDLMYGKGDVTDHGSHYSFKANTIRYSAPKNSPAGQKIAKAKLGVAFHTVYNNGKAHFGFDPSTLPHHEDVHMISPVMGHGVSNGYTPEHQKAFVSAMRHVKKTAESVSSKDHAALEPHRDHMNIYINSTVRDGSTPSAAGYHGFLSNRAAKDKKAGELIPHAHEHRDHIDRVLKLHGAIQHAKHAIIDALDSHDHEFHHEIEGAPAKPEGYVAVDKNRASKFVNRAAFSRANFLAGGIKKAKVAVVEGFINRIIGKKNPNNPVTAVFGKVRIPTIGHRMLVDIAATHARKHGHKLNVTLSGADKPLSVEQKKAHAERVFGRKVNTADVKTDNVVKFLSHLHSQGHKEVHLFAGSDRAPEYEKMLQNYNGKPDKKGNVPFAFKKWKVHTVGAERTSSNKHPTEMDHKELMSSVSASKLEKLAKSNDYAGFKAYHPRIKEKHVKELYDQIRSSK